MSDFVIIKDGRLNLFQAFDTKSDLMARGETEEDAERLLRSYIAEAEELAGLTPPEPPPPPEDLDEVSKQAYINIGKALKASKGQIRQAARILEVKVPTFHSQLLPGRLGGPLRDYAGDLREFWYGTRDGRMPALGDRDRLRLIQIWEKSGRSPSITAKELGLSYSTTLDQLNRLRVPGAPPSPRYNADGSERPRRPDTPGRKHIRIREPKAASGT